MYGVEFGRITAYSSKNYARRESNIPDFDKIALDLFHYCTRLHIVTPFNYLATIATMGGDFFILEDRVKIVFARFVDIIPCSNYVPIISPEHCELFYIIGMDFQFAVYNHDIVNQMFLGIMDSLDAHNDCCDASYVYMVLVCNKNKKLIDGKRDYLLQDYSPTETARVKIMEIVKLCNYYDHYYAYLPPVTKYDYFNHDKNTNSVTISASKVYDVGTWCVCGSYYARPAHGYEDFSTMYTPKKLGNQNIPSLLSLCTLEPFFDLAKPPSDLYYVRSVQSIAGLIIVNSPYPALASTKGYFEWRMLSYARFFEAYLKICCDVGIFKQIQFLSSYIQKGDFFTLGKTGIALVSVPMFYFDLFNETTRVQNASVKFDTIVNFNLLKNIYAYRKSYILAPLTPYYANLYHNGYKICDATEFLLVQEVHATIAADAPPVKACVASTEQGKALSCGVCRRLGCPYNAIEENTGKVFTHSYDQRYKNAIIPWACLLSMNASDYSLYPNYCDKNLNFHNTYAAKSVGVVWRK
jgi:hypothetical protein